MAFVQGRRHRGGWGDLSTQSAKPGGYPPPPPPGIDDLPTFLTGMKNFEIENRPC